MKVNEEIAGECKMGSEKIVAVIVVYNKKIEASITCERIRSFNDLNIRILVVDNSDIEQGNDIYCKKYGIDYISMNGNKGLSKAYNSAIDASRDADVIILFDDDTEVTKEYFYVLNTALKRHLEIDIFAPVIYGQDGVIYSPNMYNFLKSRFISEPTQEIPQDKFNGIASCLAIRRHVFDNYRFNEILFVDQVDQNFFWDQRKLGRKFMKLDVPIQQNFYQRGENLTAEMGWKRLKLRITDIMRQARLIGGIQYSVLAYIKCCGLGVQIGKKCKSINVVIKAFVLSTKFIFMKKIEC